MKKLQVPGIVNLYIVEEPEEIRGLARNPLIDRDFSLRTCPLNWLLLKRPLAVLSVAGRRFPTMLRRDSAQRQIQQQELAASLRARAAAIRLGPEELEPLARWIRGEGSESDVGILAQQLLGRLFSPTFVATPESWAAAQVLVQAPRSPNLLKVLWWFATGRVKRSQRLLAGMVDGDLSAVNAIGIAVHNLVKGLRQMRSLYADDATRAALTPEAARNQCLFGPASLVRQATEAGQLGDCPFPRHSLFVLEIGKASLREAGRPLVFMDGTWSRCPAADWVPAMLEGLWLRAARVADPVPTPI
ncbi:MAG TPA: hypothetical protein VMM92_01895 [Thermoanaerobaculia bacterium]|nr:hypothetical protein [Thermoanaerobaculia bacterium]